ncbi:DUF7127 family protein [Halococcus hamelinensis]|uniref:Hsp20/alpha crystallin family protein n=1 Tax=Halococcus hamelinensis 100A6 TaxID=1132509 RepID=M0LWW5_9EURY|nr:hypothetical protein [Halococcus hamelinensis]EMA36580.1 hypothetical protein C447_15021 [Halococcus hamelinensis 100A6]
MTPTLQQFDNRDDVLRRYEYADRVVYAADLGPAADTTTVDVVEGTVMLVRGDEQADFDIPETGSAEATINNGVLTVEVAR